MTADAELPAGDFADWLDRMRRALRERTGMDVPCGTCRACCTSSHFVQIGPDETETLAAIPPELHFPAPGLPAGHRVMGYDARGHCPMLIDGDCSIYAHRPRTCRTYDCRVFGAAGIAADRTEISERARRWRFSHPTRADDDRQRAVQAAARFLQANAACFPGGVVPDNPTPLALLAVEVHELFLAERGRAAAPGHAAGDAELAARVREAIEKFGADRDLPRPPA
jgi:uncharacterized protein